MNQQQAAALLMYLQRAHGIVPTTGAEWNMMQNAITMIEGVAGGLIEVGVTPATSAEKLPAATAENPLSADITNVASRL